MTDVAMTGATPLRDVIKAYDLRADKRLGQHFLLDPNVLARIAAQAGDLAGQTVLEIGPGPGGLTRALLATNARRIIAIERDPRCVRALNVLATNAGERLEVREGDALTLDLASLGEEHLTIVANLPYNIGTQLLIRWLERRALIDQMVLMFQREVADRLIAQPRSKAYGRLSVLVQWLCVVERLFNLPAAAFVPPPKVASTLIRLAPRHHVMFPAEQPVLERVLAAAFGQRRKMLRTSLRSITPTPGDFLAKASVPETARAEDIDIEGFCRLARVFSTYNPNG